MKKVLVIAKEHSQWYNKEMYIWWSRPTIQGTWYYLIDNENLHGRIAADLYVGESQIKHL